MGGVYQVFNSQMKHWVKMQDGKILGHSKEPFDDLPVRGKATGYKKESKTKESQSGIKPPAEDDKSTEPVEGPAEKDDDWFW